VRANNKNVAVIGTGLIGRGWAIVFARAGYTVRVYDAQRYGEVNVTLGAISGSCCRRRIKPQLHARRVTSPTNWPHAGDPPIGSEPALPTASRTVTSA
jgi:glycine/D-amino acid oxidase-like deaminating enzyme